MRCGHYLYEFTFYTISVEREQVMMWRIKWLCIIRNYRAMEVIGSLICRPSDECNGIKVSESNQPMWFGMALRILPTTPIDLILKVREG